MTGAVDTTKVALRDRAQSKSKLAEFYDESFYKSQVAPSLEIRENLPEIFMAIFPTRFGTRCRLRKGHMA